MSDSTPTPDAEVDDGPDETVPDEWKFLVPFTQNLKDSRVASAPGDANDDMIPYCVWYRGGEAVAFGVADAVDRVRGVTLMRLGVFLFTADAVVLLVDAHMSDSRFKERYGRLPDPGELELLCENEGACNVGLITDCIVVNYASRAGELWNLILPYHVDKKKVELEFVTDAKAKKAKRHDPEIVRSNGRWWRVRKSVHWMGENNQFIRHDPTKKHGLVGRIPDALREAFNVPVMEQVQARALAEGALDEEITDRRELDVMACRLIAKLGFQVGLGFTSEEEAEQYKTLLNFEVSDDLGSQIGVLRKALQDNAERERREDEAERERRRALRKDGQPSAYDLENEQSFRQRAQQATY